MPAFAAVGPVLVVAMSAIEAIVVTTEEFVLLPSLLVSTGSGVAELLRAVFLTLVRVAGATKLTVRITVLTARDAIGGKLTIPVTGS